MSLPFLVIGIFSTVRPRSRQQRNRRLPTVDIVSKHPTVYHVRTVDPPLKRPTMKAPHSRSAALLVTLMALAAPMAASAHPMAIQPGEWSWTLHETSSPVGASHVFHRSECMKSANAESMASIASGPAGACARGETSTNGPGNAMIYRFTCQQSDGPIQTDSRGEYRMQVSPDHQSMQLQGTMVSQVSGAASMTITTTVTGHANRTGPCH